MKKDIFKIAIILAASIFISCASAPNAGNASSKDAAYPKTDSTHRDWTKKTDSKSNQTDSKKSEKTSRKYDGKKSCSRNLSDKGIKSFDSLANFFLSENPDISATYIRKFAKMYVEEANEEGLNSDCAFVQMCLETGFLRFGGLVTPEMHNYCGLGAIDENHRGLKYATEREGIRAHIQHLHAYATTADKKLKNELIDPRYKYVNPRGKAPTIEGLAGTWAADRSYAIKLDNLLSRLEEF